MELSDFNTKQDPKFDTTVNMQDINLFGDPKDLASLTEIIKPGFLKDKATFTPSHKKEFDHYKNYIKNKMILSNHI